jgi:hypothetical protein
MWNGIVDPTKTAANDVSKSCSQLDIGSLLRAVGPGHELNERAVSHSDSGILNDIFYNGSSGSSAELSLESSRLAIAEDPDESPRCCFSPRIFSIAWWLGYVPRFFPPSLRPSLASSRQTDQFFTELLQLHNFRILTSFQCRKSYQIIHFLSCHCSIANSNRNHIFATIALSPLCPSDRVIVPCALV